jgi:hypothetical protein
MTNLKPIFVTLFWGLIVFEEEGGVPEEGVQWVLGLKSHGLIVPEVGPKSGHESETGHDHRLEPEEESALG